MPGTNSLIVCPKDSKYDSDGIATHDKQVLPAVAATVLDEMKEKADDFSVIGIDEGQFFPDTVEFAEEMANRGKIVIVAALDGTYQRLGFGDILRLVPLAESIVKLTAVCMICYEEALITHAYLHRNCRKCDRIYFTVDASFVEVIGGSEKYIATCRQCFFISTPQKRPGASPLKPVQENMETNESSSSCKRRLMDGKEGTGTVTADKENCSMQMA
nr:thymidine kinase, cytosolic-like [Penaeus vannamei]